MEGLWEGKFETGVYPDEWHWRKGFTYPHMTKEIVNGWKSDRLVASVVLNSALGRLCSQLGDWQGARLGQDDVIDKPAGGTPVGYHRDSVYISRNFLPTTNNSITCWMALDDADAGNGAIEYAAHINGQSNPKVWASLRLKITELHFGKQPTLQISLSLKS
eukprot:TRINITY_DN3156_c0_g1_i1.p1 TRINITY_DN3156_c0_g1~~TRINITY_DN3156_c0_g1_i1.p1  ORF type:complete len:161 (+),score=27.16 TRINITY_DN3156_c0_g1_i1:222-704(+)